MPSTPIIVTIVAAVYMLAAAFFPDVLLPEQETVVAIVNTIAGIFE